ncbi:hypothetical protein [uncultured Mediterranean phage uvMED]|nr:hypothetical protein [uncultured Mediterranean phage uvMED]
MSSILSRTLKFDCPGFSINSWYSLDLKSRSVDSFKWGYKVFDEINKKENQVKIRELSKVFDSNKHTFSVRLIFYYPENVFYTKAGSISSRSHDLSNLEKPIIDLIFIPSHFGEYPNGSKNMNCDDRFITELFSAKKVGKAFGIKATISIKPLKRGRNG